MQNVLTSAQNFFPVMPTTEQEQAFLKFEEFVSPGTADDFLIVQGAAGTGKTTMVKAFVSYLEQQRQTYALAAPTGRAAKILAAKTGETACTLHHLIYSIEDITDKEGHVVGIKFIRRNNWSEEPQVYLVDEASMVSDVLDKEGYFQAQASALEDFVKFVRSGNERNKIVFIGDSYQLPPVKSNLSPALDAAYLQNKFGLQGSTVQLTEVKRQEHNSAVLHIATTLRERIRQNTFQANVSFKDAVAEGAAVKRFVKLFDCNRLDKSVFLVWRNEVADRLNAAIRKMLHPELKRLNENDVVVVNKSVYSNGKYLVNGEIGVCRKVFWNSLEKRCDLTFVDAEIEFADSTGSTSCLVKVLLDALEVPGGWIPREKGTELYADRMRYNHTFRKSKNKCDDPYLSAMQLRFGYALTCHKAQGGEWENVFLYNELPYGSERLRWLYTAVTRSSQNLHPVAAGVQGYLAAC